MPRNTVNYRLLSIMMHKRKISALFSAMAFVAIGITMTQVTAMKDRNLKILPKDISDEKLDSIMQTYNKALGVSCEFCHAKKLVFPGDLDFASDKEPMKEEARKMMRMVIDINKNNFCINIFTGFYNGVKTLLCKIFNIVIDYNNGELQYRVIYGCEIRFFIALFKIESVFSA